MTLHIYAYICIYTISIIILTRIIYYYNRNQTNVRLPSVDAKLAACELLIPVLDRMNSLQNDQLLLSEITKEIMTLEQVLEQIKEGFARKLKLHRNENNSVEEVIPTTTTTTQIPTNDSLPNSPSTIHPSPSSSSYYHNSSSNTNGSTSNKTSQVIIYNRDKGVG